MVFIDLFFIAYGSTFDTAGYCLLIDYYSNYCHSEISVSLDSLRNISLVLSPYLSVHPFSPTLSLVSVYLLRMRKFFYKNHNVITEKPEIDNDRVLLLA